MPVENRKSTIVGNADAVPAVLTSPRIAGGHLRAQVATIEVAAADDDTSVYRLFRLPSNAKVTAIMVFNDAITGGTSYDVGLYRTAADGGAAVDVDAFASAVDMSSARAAAGPLNLTFEAQNIDKIEQVVQTKKSQLESVIMVMRAQFMHQQQQQMQQQQQQQQQKQIDQPPALVKSK